MSKIKLFFNTKSVLQIAGLVTLTGLFFLSNSNQVMAHHAFGGQTPDNFFEGFLSGLAHPIIGLDHFAFVVAVGLLAATVNKGIFSLISFVLATIAGTGIHLLEWNLPAVEILIALSVIGFGVLLAKNNTEPQKSGGYKIILAILAAIAGIFHGYAYGEAIVGAEMTPLVAYLAGFAVIQLTVALAASILGKIILEKLPQQPFPILRFLGLAIAGMGIVFLTSAAIG
ncbi:HupE/UreJ family protein [Oscillatoria salina]|uniref:HupE/UreJ family protein n=1 Tax=Oscillatoria salina TaxID=331517 RepID=UPI0013B6A7C3|nr:HupE/UreJ family protein [Oscillatoria salina]MBZ8182968.1 HupE/UreJ family protein [Oscillatoria salina IIICB1]NET86526.1 HupE/UreJ family protein [Kamptonema sp. SIO1D9]